jgi:hypothetical protein
MKLRNLLIILYLVMFGLVLHAEAVEFGIRGYYWFTDIEGEIRLDDGGTDGTLIDVKDDLGLDDENFPVIEGYIGMGKHQLSFSYFNLDFDGDNLLDRSITFNGVTFNAGERIRTDWETDVYDIKYQYDLVKIDNILAGFTGGLVARLQILDGEAKIKSRLKETDDSYTQLVPYGGINLKLGLLPESLETRLLATGGYYKGPWVDSQLEISYAPIKWLKFDGGYRLLYFDIDPGNSELNDFYIGGPYLGATLQF